MFYFQGEIDAREDSYESTLDAGTKLVETDHYAADEVREKVGMFHSFVSRRILTLRPSKNIWVEPPEVNLHPVGPHNLLLKTLKMLNSQSTYAF